ncbi:MAG: helix-turn-helix domain-containing protein, partial [Actinobacteria bacterium]|nr:helix-turn-helix domain-containing protein [Actinomycetota bacterium]
EVLRQERENQRMTLDEVAQRTKISRRHLAALEDGRREDLPHLVYVTGFIKAYAAVLGGVAFISVVLGGLQGLTDVSQTLQCAVEPSTANPQVRPMSARPSRTGGPGRRQAQRAARLPPLGRGAEGSVPGAGSGATTPSSRSSRSPTSRPAKRQTTAPREARARNHQAAVLPSRAVVPKSMAAQTR